MRYCVKCGRQVEDSMNFLSVMWCTDSKKKRHIIHMSTVMVNIRRIRQSSAISENKLLKEEGTDRVLAVLAYLGLLVFVPILSGSKSEFVRFHANQGLVLFICSVLWNALNWILSRFVWFMDVGIISLGDLLGIVNLALVVLAIVGIVNACKSKK